MRSIGALALSGVILSCGGAPVGDADSATGGPTPGDAPRGTNGSGVAAAAPGALLEARVWRLTRDQYDNTVRDLLGDTSAPARGFVPESGGTGFSNAEATLTINAAALDQFARAAQKLAYETVTNASRLALTFPCGAEKLGDPACTSDFVASFGRRAFRRPLSDEETRRYHDLYTAALDKKLDPRTGLQIVIEAMLSSPHFLYRSELGDGRVAAGCVRLTAHETAAQLSYYLWDSLPDAELAAAADTGALLRPDELERQARRLLADMRARRVVWGFFGQLAGYDDLADLQKSDKSFSGARSSMAQETQRFVEEVLWAEDGALGRLLTSKQTFVNKSLAPLYGLPEITGSQWMKVTVDGRDRAGFLTHPALMAVTSHVDGTSPVLRGKFVAERLLCLPVPDRPPDVMADEPAKDPARTTRERYARHATQPSCAACHKALDAPGYAFEHLDPLGRVRRTENGSPVDTSGELAGTDIDGRFANVGELAERLARSAQVRGCFARQVFRFASGVREGEEHTEALREMTATLERGAGSVIELLLSHVKSERFLVRRAP